MNLEENQKVLALTVVACKLGLCFSVRCFGLLDEVHLNRKTGTGHPNWCPEELG
jgi:hypothetical protein